MQKPLRVLRHYPESMPQIKAFDEWKIISLLRNLSLNANSVDLLVGVRSGKAEDENCSSVEISSQQMKEIMLQKECDINFHYVSHIHTQKKIQNSTKLCALQNKSSLKF